MSSSRHQIVQIISFTIPNDNTFDDRFSKDGRRWANAMRNNKKQDGWLQTLWGRDVNAFHKLNLFIIWANLEQAETFQSSPTFEATLSQIAISSLSIHCIKLQGSLSASGPTDLITLFFPPLLNHTDRFLFEQQLQCFAEEMRSPNIQHKTSLSVSSGWIGGDVQRDSRMLKGCVIVLAWESLDEMYDVKKDQNGLFNNLFVPLRDEASVGSETALYTALKDAEVERSKCVVM